MSLEIALSPAGRLSVELTPRRRRRGIDARWAARSQAAFADSNADGLDPARGGALSATRLPPTPAYWRDFARAYLQRLCLSGTGRRTRRRTVAVGEPRRTRHPHAPGADPCAGESF